MSPSITEILFAVGAGDRVVGVTEFCDYPEASKAIAKVGELFNPSSEKIIKLRPDLVVYHYDSIKIARMVRHLGIPGVEVKFDNIQEIMDSIHTIGSVVGNSQQADNLSHHLLADIKSYKTRLANLKPRPTLLILGDSKDPMRDLYAAGPTTFLGELLKIAGGDNLLKSSVSKYPKVSREFIIAQSPEVIIVAGPGAHLEKEALAEQIKGWEKMSSIKAVQTNNVHYISADYILIPGPRMVNIISQFSRAIHPLAFEDGG